MTSNYGSTGYTEWMWMETAGCGNASVYSTEAFYWHNDIKYIRGFPVRDRPRGRRLDQERLRAQHPEGQPVHQLTDGAWCRGGGILVYGLPSVATGAGACCDRGVRLCRRACAIASFHNLDDGRGDVGATR